MFTLRNKLTQSDEETEETVHDGVHDGLHVCVLDVCSVYGLKQLSDYEHSCHIVVCVCVCVCVVVCVCVCGCVCVLPW